MRKTMAAATADLLQLGCCTQTSSCLCEQPHGVAELATGVPGWSHMRLHAGHCTEAVCSSALDLACPFQLWQRSLSKA